MVERIVGGEDCWWRGLLVERMVGWWIGSENGRWRGWLVKRVVGSEDGW